MNIKTYEQLLCLIRIQYHFRDIADDPRMCVREVQKWHDAISARESFPFISERNFNISFEDTASCKKLVAHWESTIQTLIGNYHQANWNAERQKKGPAVSCEAFDF